MRLRGRSLVVMAAAAITLSAAACTPQPGEPVDTGDLTIQSFAAVSSVGEAPALVALGWSVTGVGTATLVCRLDADGDNIFETFIGNCQHNGSRNVVLPEGVTVARLQVTEGLTPPLDATTTVVVGAAPTEVDSFDLELRGLDDLSPAAQTAFSVARDRWQSVLTRGVEATEVPASPGCWYEEAQPLVSPIDDLVIDVVVAPIDGVGGVLGQAGPCLYNQATELSTYGVMQFDTADVDNLIADGSFAAVVVHEMGHVLGIGTLWDMTAYSATGQRDLLTGTGGADPRFLGALATAEWSALTGDGPVPVENSGGAGTQDAHWREITFGNELMTGYLSAGSNPLSRLTIASLADMGYSVDVTAADPYSLPFGSALARRAPSETPTVLHPAPTPAPR